MTSYYHTENETVPLHIQIFIVDSLSFYRASYLTTRPPPPPAPSCCIEPTLVLCMNHRYFKGLENQSGPNLAWHSCWLNERAKEVEFVTDLTQ